MREAVQDRTTDGGKHRLSQLHGNDTEQADGRPADEITQADHRQTGNRSRGRFFLEG